ncbi:hypothetical protein GOP47_0013600 [Adiantum capillus-veneris]|uniref:Uncharacterized protein n=1 Tax=Adiantum capillus-veneris TaxID=13818 RepID=A0A9D4ZDJ4_ADICA|nr:hypothetical protein GOP47_0013600 [Adiantum capillus-veneris]
MAAASLTQGLHAQAVSSLCIRRGKHLPQPTVLTTLTTSAKTPFASASSPAASSSSPASAVSEEVQPNPSSSTKKDWNLKGSSQLTRWARTRRLRSGKLADKNLPESTVDGPPLQVPPQNEEDIISVNMLGDNDAAPSASFGSENMIYMVSDGTGWTVEHSVHAALGQFEHCLIDHGCPVNTHLFSEVNDVERLMEIIRDAGKERAILVYTLADPAMAETAKRACQLHSVSHLDMLGPITELLGSHMGVTPLGLPRGAPGRKTVLSRQYFKRIEAVEFTIKQDDGALPKNLHKADLVLVGVSRTSKTPLSTYMAQKGYKVANVPLVLGIDAPKELFEIDQNKIYALTINPNFLQAIRIARYKSLGVSTTSFYSDFDHIRKELEYSSKLFVQNPKWPVVEVTGKAIEETAAVILRIYHDRERKYVMPRISRRY